MVAGDARLRRVGGEAVGARQVDHASCGRRYERAFPPRHRLAGPVADVLLQAVSRLKTVDLSDVGLAGEADRDGLGFGGGPDSCPGLAHQGLDDLGAPQCDAGVAHGHLPGAFASLIAASREQGATPEGWQPGDKVIVPPPQDVDAVEKRVNEGYERRNILERAMLMADGDTLLPEHLPPALAGAAPADLPDLDAIVPLETAELRYLQWALARYGGDRKSLAEQLGISERTLYRKLAG